MNLIYYIKLFYPNEYIIYNFCTQRNTLYKSMIILCTFNVIIFIAESYIIYQVGRNVSGGQISMSVAARSTSDCFLLMHLDCFVCISTKVRSQLLKTYYNSDCFWRADHQRALPSCRNCWRKDNSCSIVVCDFCKENCLNRVLTAQKVNIW